MQPTCWLTCLVAVLLACGTGQLPTRDLQHEKPTAVMAAPTAPEAVRLALDTLEARALLKNQELRLTVKRSKSQWVVWLVYLPERFGGDVTVFVNDDRTTEVMLGF